MKLSYSEIAIHNLEKMDKTERKLFVNYIEKILENPNKRHLHFGLTFFVEKVTKQARIVYNLEKENIYILRCFKTHKEYEKWYKSFK